MASEQKEGEGPVTGMQVASRSRRWPGTDSPSEQEGCSLEVPSVWLPDALLDFGPPAPSNKQACGQFKPLSV